MTCLRLSGSHIGLRPGYVLSGSYTELSHAGRPDFPAWVPKHSAAAAAAGARDATVEYWGL